MRGECMDQLRIKNQQPAAYVSVFSFLYLTDYRLAIAPAPLVVPSISFALASRSLEKTRARAPAESSVVAARSTLRSASAEEEALRRRSLSELRPWGQGRG